MEHATECAYHTAKAVVERHGQADPVWLQIGKVSFLKCWTYKTESHFVTVADPVTNLICVVDNVMMGQGDTFWLTSSS